MATLKNPKIEFPELQLSDEEYVDIRKKIIGRHIRQQRERLSLSQDDLAKRLNYKSRSTIAKIESGENDISQSKMLMLAGALNCHVSELMAISQQEIKSEVEKVLIRKKAKEFKGRIPIDDTSFELSRIAEIIVEQFMTNQASLQTKDAIKDKEEESKLLGEYARLLADHKVMEAMKFRNKHKLTVSHHQSKQEYRLILEQFRSGNPSNCQSLTCEYPFVEGSVAAGIPSDVEGMKQLPQVEIPDLLLGHYAGNKNIILTRVNGDSMNRVFPNGAIIAIKMVDDIEELHSDDIVVFAHDYEYSVKRFYRVNDKIIFRPDSTERNYFDLTFSIHDNIRIIGKVVSYFVNL